MLGMSVKNFDKKPLSIDWEIEERNTDTGAIITSIDTYTAYYGDATPAPNLPSVNPWDGEPWTSTSIETPAQYVTGPATYHALLTYTPVTIPTGFSNPITIWSPGPVQDSGYYSEYYSYVNSDLSTACGSQSSQSYIYNNDYIIQSRINWSNYKVEIYLLEYDFSSGMNVTLISSGCLDNEQSDREYNFRYNSDVSGVISKFGSVDKYVAYLFNEGILHSTPPAP